jgi:hypothetical protein
VLCADPTARGAPTVCRSALRAAGRGVPSNHLPPLTFERSVFGGCGRGGAGHLWSMWLRLVSRRL